MDKTVQIDGKDREILHFIAASARAEVFFKELDAPRMMAKSTLSKHLRELVKEGLLRRTISKTRALGPHCVVYVATAKGRKALSESEVVKHGRLQDYV